MTLMKDEYEQPSTPICVTAVTVSTIPPTPPSTSQPLQGRTCQVVAPQTLPAGYTFPAQVDGINFTVTVPPGGVTGGQEFDVPYPTVAAADVSKDEYPNIGMAVDFEKATSGQWRNGLCDCFGVIGNGIFWQSWCCNPILHAQIMVRMKLDLLGRPGNYHSTFAAITFLWIFTIIFFFIRSARVLYYIISIYFVILFTCTRHNMRKKYNIPPTTCACFDGKVDDFVHSYFCSCCVAIQMARHTHVEKEYTYQCCTKTGLKDSAPEIV